MGIFSTSVQIPPGTLIAFAGNAVPDGFLKCNGAAISRTLYPELFNIISTGYGPGDGSTTFNLPNFIDRTFWGANLSGTVKAPGLPNITGTWVRDYVTSPSTINGCFATVAGTNRSAAGKPIAIGNNGINFNANRSSGIYGASTTVQPPALSTIICIKY